MIIIQKHLIFYGNIVAMNQLELLMAQQLLILMKIMSLVCLILKKEQQV